ncbi:uncharacterized protein LOC104883294 [Beta vulgaris subsp. vulgaris]|uniref:uncharacterized protein LOC104883294 n=1 Tax=Beta vulgaris subsp. vulgaris TaxID=3555 RepID=UPI0025474EE1|nr:uncharacterized protein LOC104883294 [Beta vulgaris subsp. vulgaris]
MAQQHGEVFDATQCPDKWKVNFAVFYLKGQADLWWKTAKEMHDQPGFGWEKLKEAMRRQFYPPSLQLQMESEFIHLKQRSMSVLEYAVKFNELARFAPDLVTTDRQRMNRFEGGLNLDIQVKLAAHMSSSYQELYDRAINVERKTKLQKEVYENGKRKGNSQGGQPSNAFKWQNTGYMGNNNGQKQVPRCNKCNKLGHIARECRWGSDQCYRCGKPGHVIKNCPLGDRGIGNVTNRVPVGDQRVMQNSGYGGNTSNNSNRYPPRGPPQAGRVFMMQREEAEADDTVITGTFPVNSIPAYVLFDSGASHSFISTSFAKRLKAKSCPEFSSMFITFPNGESVPCKILYRDCPILIEKCEFLVDLVQFDLTDFDVILGWIGCLSIKPTLTALIMRFPLEDQMDVKFPIKEEKPSPKPSLLRRLSNY